MTKLTNQNMDFSDPIEQYCLRKSIPFSLSSALKASNRISNKRTLAEISYQYQQSQFGTKSQKQKIPLIDPNHQTENKTLFYAKRPRQTFCLYSSYKENSFVKEKQKKTRALLSDKQNMEEQRKIKVIPQSIQPIKNQQGFNQKGSMQRCHSSCALNLKHKNSPLIKFSHKKSLLAHEKQKNFLQKTVPNLGIEQQDSQIIGEFDVQKSAQERKLNPKSPSFLNKMTGNDKKNLNEGIQPCEQSNWLHTKSSYCQKVRRQDSFKSKYKRMSHYESNHKNQKSQYRLCINCQTYVNTNLIKQHEQKCLGFKIILKMTNSELVDFLNEKIGARLMELRQIEESKQLEMTKTNNCTQMLHILHRKNKIDDILKDLNSIRLKALKKLHINSRIFRQ